MKLDMQEAFVNLLVLKIVIDSGSYQQNNECVFFYRMLPMVILYLIGISESDLYFYSLCAQFCAFLL